MVVLSISTYAWVHGIYTKVSHMIQEQQGAVHQLQRKVNLITQMECIQGGNKQKLECLESSFANIKVHAVTDHTLLQSRIVTLLDAARKAGLELKEYTITSEQHKDWYGKKKAQGSFVGTTKQVCNWLQALAASSGLIQCKHITLAHTNDDQYVINCTVEITQLV